MNETGKSRRIAVLGGGAWGTALAQCQCLAGQDIVLWARDPDTVAAINSSATNPRYLPGVTLEGRLRATTDPAEAVNGTDAVLVVIPTQSMRRALEAFLPHLSGGLPLVLCAKGIERSTGKFPSQIVSDLVPGAVVAALSGPSFAADVARGLPTAVTVAAADSALAGDLSARLSTPQFRCYSTDDLTGVEVGGALKNVLAIAAGIVYGAGLGASAQAALTTRGFVELRRIGASLGARPETMMGLSGLGDLILTCGSEKSRNFAYGAALGRGDPVDGLPLAEGVATASTAAGIAAENAMEAPIMEAVDHVLAGRLSIAEAMEGLLNRPLKAENH